MVKPPRKHTVEERTAYMTNPARLEREASLVDHNQKQLEWEALPWFAESNRKRKPTNDDDDLSVVSASKRPNALKGHNKFETAKHWDIPTRQRERKKPTYIYVPENNVGSPASSIDSPLTLTRRTLVVSDDYVGTRVAFKYSGIAFYGTVKRCFLNDRLAKTWECMYDNTDEEELLAVDFQKKNCMPKRECMIQKVILYNNHHHRHQNHHQLQKRIIQRSGSQYRNKQRRRRERRRR